jgi:hypothetical protein
VVVRWPGCSSSLITCIHDDTGQRRDTDAMIVAIAIAALVISLSTFVTSHWRDRRDLLLRVHHGLTTVDQQRGRRLAHQLLGEKHMAVDALMTSSAT